MADESKESVAVTTKPRETRPAVVHPFAELDRFFDRMFRRNWPSLWERPAWPELFEPLEMRVPSIDVVDRDEDVLVRAELPGVDKKDIDVSLSDNLLTIRGKTSHEVKEEKENYYRCEISRGSFSRSVTLPGAVDASRVSASLKDGMLEITLPKVEGSKRRSIKIQ